MSSCLTSSSECRIAAIAQLRASSNKFANLADVAFTARLARREGASMLFLPECFGFMGESAEQTLAQAEPPLDDDSWTNKVEVSEELQRIVASDSVDDASSLDGMPENSEVSLFDGLRTIAKESGLWISAGGMHVLRKPCHNENEKKRVCNTHIILDGQGQIKCSYEKIHLFDVSIPGKIDLRESATTVPGKNLIVCNSPLGNMTACRLRGL